MRVESTGKAGGGGRRPWTNADSSNHPELEADDAEAPLILDFSKASKALFVVAAPIAAVIGVSAFLMMASSAGSEATLVHLE